MERKSMEQSMELCGTGEWKKKEDKCVNFMKTGCILLKQNKNCEKYWKRKILMICWHCGELRAMLQVRNRFHKAKCQSNGNDANVERKAWIGKALEK